jgi:Sec-independent protein secretion pathway component TatC
MDPTTPALLALATVALFAGTIALLDFLSDRKRKRQRNHPHSA